MYVSTWPSLNPWHLFLSSHQTELPFPLQTFFHKLFFSARYGIYQLFRALRFQQKEFVLVPDYHHGNEVRAIRASGANIRFYRINHNLEPDLEQLEHLLRQKPRALYVIHYLGWPQPIEQITELCRQHGVLLIEDCALSFLSERNGVPLGGFGDYAVFCLYKSLPVPNGGLLVQNKSILPELTQLQLQPSGTAADAGRGLELILDWLRSRSNVLGITLGSFKRAVATMSATLGRERLPIGNSGFDFRHVTLGASTLSKHLLGRFAFQEIRQRRRSNYRYLMEKLEGKATMLRTDLEEGVCPLFFPILVPDKRAAAEVLWQRGIGAVEFWNEGDPEVNREHSLEAQLLRKHVLELPIHQDVTPSQLDYMAKQILTHRLHF